MSAQSRTMPPRPLVSAVITTKNEARVLPRCLEALRAQRLDRARLEVIVVDNHSDDGTAELAAGFADRVERLGPERSAQRNHGLGRLASGDLLFYLDADMIPAPDLVEAAVACFDRHPDAVGLWVREIVLGTSYAARVRRHERSFYDGTVVDAARFFRREAFLATGGFDESLTGPEDWDLDLKLKALGSLRLLPAGPACEGPWPSRDYVAARGGAPERTGAVLWHDESGFNPAKYLAKKSYYIRSMDRYRARWPGRPEVRRQFSPWYRMAGVFLENGKWTKLVRHPLLSLGMFALRLRVALRYLRRERAT